MRNGAVLMPGPTGERRPRKLSNQGRAPFLCMSFVEKRQSINAVSRSGIYAALIGWQPVITVGPTAKKSWTLISAFVQKRYPNIAEFRTRS